MLSDKGHLLHSGVKRGVRSFLLLNCDPPREKVHPLLELFVTSVKFYKLNDYITKMKSLRYHKIKSK